MNKKNRKRTSKIWTVSKEHLQTLLNENHAITDILKILGNDGYTGSHRVLWERINFDKLDISIFQENKAKWKKQYFNVTLPRRVSFETIFKTNSDYRDNKGLKKYLLDLKILKYECEICKNNGFHLDSPLSLQLDHINGINNDNRVENLRFLCPNCHSQTETFSGKRNKKVYKCLICESKISYSAKNCNNCARKLRKGTNFLSWPSLEELIKLCEENTFVGLGKLLNRSDNSIRKFLIRNGINPKTLKPILPLN